MTERALPCACIARVTLLAPIVVATVPADAATSPVSAGIRAASRVPEFRLPAFPATSAVALPTLVMSPVRLAFVVTRPAVRLGAVPVRPVESPLRPIAVNTPFAGLNVNLVLLILIGRLPAVAVTQVG